MGRSGGLRLATFNICSGRDPATGAVDPALLAAAVTQLDVDLLALQEVDCAQPRSAGRDQAADAARAMRVTSGNWRFAATLHGTPGERWEPASQEGGGPSYGVAVLSRLPVLDWSQIRLPPPPVPVRSPVVGGAPGGKARLMMLEDEPRVALAAVVDAPHGPFTFVSTHLSFVPGWNVRQLRQLHRGLRNHPRPLFLAGDLNLPGRLPALITGWQPRARAGTYPSAQPRAQLDHVLSDGWQSVAAGTGSESVPLQISDHRALVIELPAPGRHGARHRRLS